MRLPPFKAEPVACYFAAVTSLASRGESFASSSFLKGRFGASSPAITHINRRIHHTSSGCINSLSLVPTRIRSAQLRMATALSSSKDGLFLFDFDGGE